MKCLKCQSDNPPESTYCEKCATRLDPPRPAFTETMGTTREELTTGSTFAGRYQVIEELGQGGMGKVYKVHDTKIGEKIALKLIRPEAGLDKKSLERFSNELKLARKIRHKNVCQMFDLGEDQGVRYITMEYVHGEDLRQLIRKVGRLSPGQAIAIARQVCDGLEEAHKLSVVHRDLKPQNIMLDDDGNARIMDFGIARSLTGKSITGAGTFIGTPEYMSPEQVEGKDVDQRSDIYSLGVILYEMVAGRRPFDGESALSIAHKQKYETPEDPRKINPQISEGLARTILKCLEKDKAARYGSARALDADLAGIEDGLPTTEKVVPKRKGVTTRDITVTFNLRRLVVPAAAALVLIGAVFILWKAIGGKKPLAVTASSPATKSVAVLPFVDLSTDQSSEHLADGISDALINALSRIRDLRVPGRTSAFSFKGREVDVREIGQKLNVKTVLEGSVQVIGERLRIGAQLISVDDGFQLWSEKYDRKMGDIFDVQDDIARAIVDTLKIEILGERDASLVKAGTANLEAHNLYLQGRYFWNKRGKKDLQKSIEYFEKALDIDPSYALAYAGLADAYIILGNNSYLPSDEAFPKAKGFTLEALEIDNGLAEAYSSLASIKRDYEWDFEGAEREYKRAIEISPGDANAHHQYAFLLSLLGRHEDAIKEVKLACDLDPLASRIRANVGYILYLARKYEEALEELKKALEFDPNHCAIYAYLATVYREVSKYEDALESNVKSIECGPEDPIFPLSRAMIYARSGRTEDARKILNGLKVLSKKEYVSPALLASAYAALGEHDLAFDLLDRAYAERDNRLTYLKTAPSFDPLRSDPRFTALLRKIGLEN